jgi:hypothetical protein
MHTNFDFGFSGVLGFCNRRVKVFGLLLLTLLLPASSLAQVQTFNFDGNRFQSYTVPADGWYFLDVLGAQGGPASNNSHQGGKGARMQGYALLLAGDELRIAVGGAGKKGQGDGNNVSGGGGGGASSIIWVNGSTDVPLVIAGGGGGGAANYNGSSGLTSESAGPQLRDGSANGGVDGKGGHIGSDPYGGAGGAGYFTDGGTHYDSSGNTLLSYGGQAYVSGNYGGNSGQNGGDGGWGGGGEGGPARDSLFNNKDGGGGGGGGYSGGGGGANEGDGGGGGGSYVDASLDTTLCLAAQGYRFGDGLVEITPISGPPVIEQPADQQVAIGASVTLGPVYDDPTGQTTYQWMKDGVVLDGQTGASLNIASFQFTDSGGYQVLVQQTPATFITLPTFLSSSSQTSTLQGWGYNDTGQLGLGDRDERKTPTQVASDVVAVTAGYENSLFVKRDGTLWAMGNNADGQLGQGDTTERDAPVQVTSDVVAVAGGGGQSLFVKRDGTLWGMGSNGNGQLGLGNDTQNNWPTQVASDVVAVAAGKEHSLFVKRDGTLWAMGNNADGQLGLGDKTDRDTPTQVTSDVVAVTAGFDHSLFVKRDGTLWAMGFNIDGQLGLGDTTKRTTPTQVTSDVVAVAAGKEHSLFVKRDGTLWAMGYNSNGELGLGDKLGRDLPNQVTSDVVAVTAGTVHSLFVKRDGTLWVMGDNADGQLGLGDSGGTEISPKQVYFRDAGNVPTTPLIVATLPKMPVALHSLAIAEPAPAGFGLSASSDDPSGPTGIFEIAFQEAPTGDFAEAIVEDPATGWEADVLFWQDQEAVRFTARFRKSSESNRSRKSSESNRFRKSSESNRSRKSSESKKDFTAFGFFPQGRLEEIQYLALKTEDLKEIRIKLDDDDDDSNEPKYRPSKEKTEDLKKIEIKLDSNASNQARYRAFKKLMDSATWEDLENSSDEFIDTITLALKLRLPK